MAWGPKQRAARKRYRQKRWAANMCGVEGCQEAPETYYYCAKHREQRRKKRKAEEPVAA